jgi:acetyl-CoA carboxylase biotin carboxyl carrier protein
MEGRTLAIAAFNTKLDDDFQIMATDPAERAKIEAGMRETEARIEGDMDPFVAARQLDTDEIVELGDLRTYIAALVEMAYQNTGYRRVKNPRIWSMHDLGELVGGLRGVRSFESWPALTRPRPDGTVELAAPAPGLFRIAVATGDVIRGGTVLGSLESLGKSFAVVAPPAASGTVVATCDPSLARPPVDSGGLLVAIDPRAAASTSTAATSAATNPRTGGLVFRAPTSGRFYGRPSPDKPAFVNAGDELAAGTTICLLEVMKSFHRVTYGGPDLPERARVREVLVADGADVNAGDPLLALDA